MNSRQSPAQNQRRRSKPRQRREQNLLEVTVRSRIVNQQRNRYILIWMCKLLMIAGVISGSIYGVRQALQRFLWQNPEYNLAVVEINNDSSAVSRELVLSTAGLQLGQNIFNVSLAKAREALAALPQVDHVEMQRVLPNKVTIDLTERRPVAWLADGQTEDPSASDKSFLIDAKHVLFKPKRQLPEYLRLPAIYGVPTENFLSGETVNTSEVGAALDLIQRNGDTSRFQLQSIDLSKGYCMIATDSRRAQITFGLENIDRQLERLGAVLDYVATSHQEIQTVNLMVERNIPLTFAPPPSQVPETGATTPAPAEKGKAPKAGSELPIGEHSSSHPAEITAKHSSEPSASPAHKKESSLSRSAERKKIEKTKRAKANKPASELPVRRAEPVIRRALPVDALVSSATPNQTSYTSHGQR